MIGQSRLVNQDWPIIHMLTRLSVTTSWFQTSCSYPTFSAILSSNMAEDRLLSSVIRYSYRPGLRKRAHPFTLKRWQAMYSRVLYRALLRHCPALGLISQVSSSLYLIFFPQQLFQCRSLFIWSSGLPSTCVHCIYFLVLSFLLMYSSSSLSTDVFS